MAWYKRRELSMAITAIVVAIFLVQFNFDVPTLSLVTDELTVWGVVIAAFAIGLGYINLFQYYGRKVKKRMGGWPYALSGLIVLATVSILGVVQGRTGDQMMFLYTYVSIPLSGTFYSIAVFYMASAAYRGFRARSFEGTILLVCAFIGLLKYAPIGEAIGLDLGQ